MSRNVSRRSGRHNNIELLGSRPAEADVAQFRREQKTRRKFRESNRPLIVLGVILILAFVFSAAFFVSVSKEHMHISYIMELSRHKALCFFKFVTGQGATDGINFIFNRYVIALLCGAALASAGAAYQGAFRNLLASPTTLGVQSGGVLGNVIYVLCFVGADSQVIRFSESLLLQESSTLAQRNIQQLLVLAGCFAAVFIVVGTASFVGKGRFKSSDLILSGIIFSSVIASFTSIVQYYLLKNNPYDTRVTIIRSLTMGSFDRAYTSEHLLLLAVVLVPCLVVMVLVSSRMNALALDADEARSLGISVKLFRNAIVVVNTVATAAVIAFCGQIAFVGFIIPLAARRIVGPDFRRVVPASMILGALLLIVVYDVALQTGLTLYINLITSALGSVVMIVAFIKGRGMTHAG